jgi:hypothetical protein
MQNTLSLELAVVPLWGLHMILIIKTPWNKLKEDYFGGHNVALHAADMHSITKVQIEALGNFFNTYPFSRFFAILKITTYIHKYLTPYQLISGAFSKRIEKISSYYPFQSIVMIFESSERTDLIAAEHFGSWRFIVDGEEVPINRFRMDKSAREPGLEVADFIVHTAGSQVRNRLTGKKGWRKDFETIFHNVDERLVSYLEIDSANLLSKV